MPLTQSQRLARSRLRLIESALVVASRASFEATSVQDIGQHAGMSRGAVNFAFGSKDALFDAMVEAQGRQWRNIAQTVPDTASLPDWLDAHRAAFAGDPQHRRVIFMLLYAGLAKPEYRPAVAALRTEFIEFVSRHLSMLQSQGSISDALDIRATALLIVSGVIGLLADGEFDDAPARAGTYAEFRNMLAAVAEPSSVIG